MGNYFKNWVFKQLPHYYSKTDTNKNTIGEGTLQRYLQVSGVELDEEVVPFIEEFMDLIDTIKVDPKFLPLLGSLLGYPPTIDGTTATYRKILAYIIQIYKLKGTAKSFEIMFNLIGLEITIIEEVPAGKRTYDQEGVIYDAEVPEIYDTECANCSGYWIAYNSVNDTCDPVVHTTVTPETLAFAANIICFLNPINAKFLGFIPRLKVCDTWIFDAQDEVTFCAPPTNIQSSYSTITNTATITWIGTGTFEIRYRQIVPTIGAWSSSIYSSSPYTTGAFTPGVVYEYQIRKICTETDFSPWVNVIISSGKGLLNNTGYTLYIENIRASNTLGDPTFVVYTGPLTLPPGAYFDFDTLPADTYDQIAIGFEVAPPITGGTISTEFSSNLPGYFSSVLTYSFPATGTVQVGSSYCLITLT